MAAEEVVAMVPLLGVLLVSPLGLLGLADGWHTDCSSSKSNDLKTSALLYAHRCYLKVKPAGATMIDCDDFTLYRRFP